MLPPRLYAIADLGVLGAAGPAGLGDAVAAMAGCGVRWIQLRAKDVATDRALVTLAEACLERLAGTGSALWLNDRADIAALLPVAGLHLGQRDLPPAAARAILGPQVAIGSSTHDAAQVRAADADPAVDAIAVGPVFATTGKKDPEPVVGLELVRRARTMTAKPLIAIGGIDADNAAAVLEAGADTVAVLGAVCRGDVAANCRRLQTAVGSEP